MLRSLVGSEMCIRDRSYCFPCGQIALNQALLEGNISEFPREDCCCGPCPCCLPKGMNCCDVCCAAPNYQYMLRSRVRRHFRIRGDPIDDCWKMCFCFCCMVSQDAHVLAAENPGQPDVKNGTMVATYQQILGPRP
eukprot:TRINITY_DN991_c0_g1_i2.p1 TRINITY_DN991_c0_g1~~TRINITY_DN991_c0_g1_i2.p1  ORF type:complete len:136 (+),score=19.55 TRINITY_DN991_c0_g1_i2:103-510(+)